MKIIRVLLTLLFVLCASHGFAAQGELSSESAKPSENLDTAIPHGITLLEGSKHKEFLETFVPPEQFKKMTETKGVEEFVAAFGKEKAARLLAVLKAIKGAKPTMEDDGKKATFDIPGDAGGVKKTITFLRIENRWYIGN
jgi:hypothetical protein